MVLRKETINEQLFSFMPHQGHITHGCKLTGNVKFLLNDFVTTTLKLKIPVQSNISKAVNKCQGVTPSSHWRLNLTSLKLGLTEQNYPSFLPYESVIKFCFFPGMVKIPKIVSRNRL